MAYSKVKAFHLIGLVLFILLLFCHEISAHDQLTQTTTHKIQGTMQKGNTEVEGDVVVRGTYFVRGTHYYSWYLKNLFMHPYGKRVNPLVHKEENATVPLPVRKGHDHDHPTTPVPIPNKRS